MNHLMRGGMTLLMGLLLAMLAQIQVHAAGNAIKRAETSFNEPPRADVSEAAGELQRFLESPSWLRQTFRTLYSDDGRWSIVQPRVGLTAENVVLSTGRSASENAPRLYHVWEEGVKEFFFTADSRYLIGMGKKRILVFRLKADGSIQRLSPYPLQFALDGVPAYHGSSVFLLQGAGKVKRIVRNCRASDLGLACISVDWPRYDRGGSGLVAEQTGAYLSCRGTPAAGIVCRHRLAKDRWSDLIRIPAEQAYAASEFANTVPSRWLDGYPTHVYGLSARSTNTASLVEMNLADLSETVLHNMPDQNIDGVIYRVVDQSARPVAALPVVVGTAPILFDPWLKGQMAQLAGNLPAKIDRSNIVGWSRQGRFIALRLSLADRTARLVEFDLQENTSRVSQYAAKTRVDSCTPALRKIKARDGLELPVLVQRPSDINGPVPTIVYAHGGPFLHENGDTRVLTGILCKAGFAVVSVNFRGSTGFGKQLYEAGIGVMTTGAPDDVVDTGRWAVQAGIARKGAVHLLGGSYGGYAVLNAAIRTDNEFASVVSINGVTDMTAIARKFSRRESAFGRWRRFFQNGQHRLADGLEYMHLPDFADRLKIPAYLIAGTVDQVVPVTQSRSMATAMKDGSGDIAYTELQHLGHGMNGAQIVECAKLILGFLQRAGR